jgi:hypothetical protein
LWSWNAPAALLDVHAAVFAQAVRPIRQKLRRLIFIPHV